MDEYRTLCRTAMLFGLRREDVRGIKREGEGGCSHAISLLLPSECVSIANDLAAAMNDALNIEAGLGNETLFDLWGARHFRFMMEAKWYEKWLVAYFPQLVDRKYAHLTRDLVRVALYAEGEDSPAREGQCAVVITTGELSAERAEAILSALEAHEQRLRTITRCAAPSHHLLAAPAKEDSPAALPVAAAPTKPAMPKFAFTPVFAESAPASMKITA